MHYDVPKSTRKCHASGRELRPGERYYSVLVETPLGHQRHDFAYENWPGPPENAVGYWLSQVADEADAPSKPREVSIETMLDLFDRLDEPGDDPQREQQFRYMLGLMLVRKRALKLHNLRREGTRQWLVVRRPPAGDLIELADPCLTEDQVQQLENDLHEWIDVVTAGDRN